MKLQKLPLSPAALLPPSASCVLGCTCLFFCIPAHFAASGLELRPFPRPPLIAALGDCFPGSERRAAQAAGSEVALRRLGSGGGEIQLFILQFLIPPPDPPRPALPPLLSGQLRTQVLLFKGGGLRVKGGSRFANVLKQQAALGGGGVWSELQRGPKVSGCGNRHRGRTEIATLMSDRRRSRLFLTRDQMSGTPDVCHLQA